MEKSKREKLFRIRNVDGGEGEDKKCAENGRGEPKSESVAIENNNIRC